MSNLFMLECGIHIDPIVPAFARLLINAVKIIVPIILIVFGIIEMLKAATANDEKVMKEAQSKLIKRIVYAILIFFIVAIVQLVFNVLGQAGSNEAKNSVPVCISCFTYNGDDCWQGN